MDLLKALAEAKLAGEKVADGYHFNTNEQAARTAIVEFEIWLRAKAQEQYELGQASNNYIKKKAFRAAQDRFDKIGDEVAAMLDPKQ